MTHGSYYDEFIQSLLPKITFEELMNMDSRKIKAQQRIDAIKKELAELEAIVNKPERWQDKLHQSTEKSYYYLDGHSLDGFSVHCNYPGVHNNRKPEYAFATWEQAKLVKEKMILMQEMLAFAHVRNEGKIFDWSSYKNKHGIVMNGGRAAVNTLIMSNVFVFGIAVKSEEIAEEMLEIFGKRIEQCYIKQY